MLCLFINIVLIGVNSVYGSCSHMRQAYEHSEREYYPQNAIKQQLIDDGFVVSFGQPGAVFFNDLPLSYDLRRLYKKSSILINAEQTYSQLFLSRSDRLPISNEEKLSLIAANDTCILGENRCRNIDQICREKYRSIDGYCNNLQNHKSGSSYTAFLRLAPAVYEDGIHSVRRNSVTKAELVSSMIVNNNLTQAPPVGSPELFSNYAGVIFGQFITHDMSLRNIIQNDNGGQSIRCCSSDYSTKLPQELLNSGCHPIDVPSNDPFFSLYNMTCMNFLRSQPILSNDCKLGPAELVNTVSTFLDASNIYGSVFKVSRELRTFIKGKLRVNKYNILADYPGSQKVNYYFAGDLRANQHPTIALINSVFLRLHNQIAEQLYYLNNFWNDERLFQESRRIVIAIYQNIAYAEWMPVFFGNNYTIANNLTCPPGTLYCGEYNPDLEPGNFNEFSQAAFRAFHTFVPPEIDLYDAGINILKSYNLSDVIQQPQLVQDNFDGFLYGMLYQSADLTVPNNDIETKLFKNYNPFGVGISLTAHDVERGRDHGVAPYYVYQEMCAPNSKKVETWADLELNISPANIQQLQLIYDSPLDVDAFAAFSLENTINGYLGAVAMCIITKQFYTIKYSDRFFYSFPNNPYPFTEAQLTQINQYKFANLLCDTTDAGLMSPQAFVIPGLNNEISICAKIQSLNVTLWAEE